MIVNCPHCGKTNRDLDTTNLVKPKCAYCKNQLFETRNIKVFVECPSCKIVQVRNHLGWTKTKCKSCATEIMHPVLKKTRGGHVKGKAGLQAHMNFKMSPEIFDDIKKHASQMGTTNTAIARYLIRIGLERLS